MPRHTHSAGPRALTAAARAIGATIPAFGAAIFASGAAILAIGTAVPARAQTISTPTPAPQATPAPERKVGWFNSTELSLVATDGNSNTTALGFKNTLTHRWTASWATLRLDSTRTATADDRYELVDPGFSWEPGAVLPTYTTTTVDPPSEPDVEKYFVEGRFDRKTGGTRSWNGGASWDRNSDAGIINRYIVFAGVGNVWQDTDDRRLHTSYGISWTDREEETSDPEKDETFAGVRLGSRYSEKMGQVTTYKNDTTFNVSLKDTSDYSADMVNSVAVAMSKRLSLKVSLQWLYNHEPALEDVDLVARVTLLDPDGVPGSGDELFETVAESGTEITLGETQVRKKSLDSVFNVSLVISL
jgi:putative salt-induced outer membrane protein YdiY